VTIKAGQCFNVGLPGIGINREYSIYSAAEAPYIEFLIRSVKGGLVSPRLLECRPGDLVEVDGPYGEFCLPNPMDLDKNYLFVATGTGIAPFHSFVGTYPNLMKYNVVHGVRTEHECYESEHYAKGSYLACISRPLKTVTPQQRVTDYLAEHPVPPNTVVFLCGNRNMIIDACDLLFQQGINGDHVVTEVFF